jgi:hypothetical protein
LLALELEARGTAASTLQSDVSLQKHFWLLSTFYIGFDFTLEKHLQAVFIIFIKNYLYESSYQVFPCVFNCTYYLGSSKGHCLFLYPIKSTVGASLTVFR